MVHEAVGWNPVDRSWLFLPRRFSQESYDEASDEERGSNKAIKVNEAFNKVTTTEVGVSFFKKFFEIAYDFFLGVVLN